ncbi:MAG TPA: Flp pilus assembly protein CpaB, partial [Victivallales bacterium]|nr:Flp pilus assembly protein CpaB [Victivallales bacterium]
EIEAQSLSDVIAKNKRAVTVPVDQISAVGFNITPGDRVDIIATKDSGCGGAAVNILAANPTSVRDLLETSPQATQTQDKSKTFVVMQDVLVLAVGQDFNTFQGRSPQTKSYSSVTLEVSLEEAMMLTHARNNATLSMVLRNPATTSRMACENVPDIDCDNIRSSVIPRLDKQRALDAQHQEQSDISHAGDSAQPPKTTK